MPHLHRNDCLRNLKTNLVLNLMLTKLQKKPTYQMRLFMYPIVEFLMTRQLVRSSFKYEFI